MKLGGDTIERFRDRLEGAVEQRVRREGGMGGRSPQGDDGEACGLEGTSVAAAAGPDSRTAIPGLPRIRSMSETASGCGGRC